jgi:hypothetical protein
MDDDLEVGEAQTTEEPGASLEDEVLAAIGLEEEAEPKAEEPAAEERPAQPAQAAEPAKQEPPKDKNAELYAPLPEHNPRKTHERFQKLIEGHRQLDEKVKELEPLATRAKELEAKVQEHEQGWKVFQDLGFNSDEAVTDLVQFSQYRNALASGDFNAAAAVLQEQARQLSLLSGRKIDVNPLAGFQDLDQRVQAGEIDESTAMELARHRESQRRIQERSQAQAQQYQSQAAQAQTIQQAAMEVDRAVQELMRDADFAAVEPELTKQLDAIRSGYPPNMWAREIKRAYDYEKRLLAAKAPQAMQPPPLRASGHGGGKPAPTSMEAAVLQALGFD